MGVAMVPEAIFEKLEPMGIVFQMVFIVSLFIVNEYN